MDSCNRTVSLRARQSCAQNWVLFTVVSQLFATGIKYIRDVLTIRKKEESRVYCTFSHFVIDTINWLLDYVSYNSGVIVLVISNRPRATRSADYSLNCTPLSPITITNFRDLFWSLV